MKRKTYYIPYGEAVEGYAVPVLNEREIRAAAGIQFVGLFMAFVLILFEQNFLLVKYVVFVFLTDFSIRLFISSRYSPMLIIGRLIVSRQVPEYVGAAQKKFAWKIGFALSGLMFLLLVVLNSYSIFTLVSCLVCLIFLFFESAFGICLGCLFYALVYKEQPLYCAGNSCTETRTQVFQQTSVVQLLIVTGSLVYMLLAITFFNEHFRVAPKHLKDVFSPSVAKNVESKW